MLSHSNSAEPRNRGLDTDRFEITASMQRVAAHGSASFEQQNGKTRLERLYQQGSAKIRFPTNHNHRQEAVLINTAGGLTGGDRLGWEVRLGKDTRVVVTSQAFEKAYRSNAGSAHVSHRLSLAKNSMLHWLPQETILFDRSSLSRRFDVTMERNARFLAVESVMLGRATMGEKISTLYFSDQWRVYYDNSLVFADHVKLNDAAWSLTRLGGRAAFASLLYVSAEAEELLASKVERLRAVCVSNTAGFSTFDGKITGRFVAQDSYHLRKMTIPVIQELGGAPLPRLWRL